MRVGPTLFNLKVFSSRFLTGIKRIHNAYYGEVKKSGTLLIFNQRMRMSQYFHIKTDIMVCLGQGSFFPSVVFLYGAVMHIFSVLFKQH